MRPLILIGGGGHCKSVIDAARSAGHRIAAILDVKDKVGMMVNSVPIAGTEDDISSYSEDCDFIVAVGFIKDPTARNRIYRNILIQGGSPATVIASSAHVSESAVIGRGSVVFHGACINAGANIGENVIINTLACVEHDVYIGDNSHISTCAAVNGGTHIGNSVFIGSHATVKQCTRICDGAIIGAGCVVVRDILEPGIYVGVPARRL